MNIHPDRNVPMHDRKWIIERNIQSLRELLPVAEQCGVGLMIENLPGEFNTLAQLAQLLDPLPSLGLHLDIGHANLMVEKNTTGEIIETYGSRLRLVDSVLAGKGGDDYLLHARTRPLPCPGTGTSRAARRAAAQFDRMDVNRNGVLDPAERRTWRSQHPRGAGSGPSSSQQQ